MGLLIFLLVLGLTLLFFGAEYMVQGASNMAFHLGITPLVIGLTVVAFGTSAPELVVTLQAAISESPELSLGNILGSNVCNIALILGIAALIRPLHVDPDSLRRDYPVMLLSSLALYFFAYTGNGIEHYEGFLLFAGLITYIGYNFYLMRKDREKLELSSSDLSVSKDNAEETELKDDKDTLKNTAFLIGGMLTLVLGAVLVVNSAIEIADGMGIPKFIIAVSVVAFGTSLPELATSSMAAFKGESDICVGNVIGSNIFNVMLIMGFVPMLFGLDVPNQSVLTYDFPVMVGFSLLLYPIMRTGFYIGRLKGSLLLLGYFSYVTSMIWNLL